MSFTAWANLLLYHHIKLQRQSAFTQQHPELYTIMMTRVQEMPVMNRNMLMLPRPEFASFFCRQHCEPG